MVGKANSSVNDLTNFLMYEKAVRREEPVQDKQRIVDRLGNTVSKMEYTNRMSQIGALKKCRPGQEQIYDYFKRGRRFLIHA